jgi:phage portal protein BeeE
MDQIERVGTFDTKAMRTMGNGAYWRSGDPRWGDPPWLGMAAQRFGRRLKAFTMRFLGRAGAARQFLPRSRVNYRREVGDGFSSSVVVAPILWIARTFPEAPLRVGVRNSDGLIEYRDDHPLLELLDNPNPHFTGIDLWMGTRIDYEASGNAYWLKVRGAMNRVVQIWYAPSWTMEPRWPDDGTQFISH